ncbi:hypothetical protein TWF696_007589 [Orbilia brochopaga]|uniref:F-box domain-containing protein n=1 Tax=Orbilia brochopaga TaxID=3140254 RepID=A0AAV9UKY1_9PEZI
MDDNNKNDTHDPNDILNPHFIDLFIEESPPEWTLEDRHALSVIRGQPEQRPAAFQRLPVELIEHIAYNLVQFRDIRALGSTCTLFHQVLFGSANHFFWFRWAGAPHSLCRWDLGRYRQNRAYQATIVNQQSGKRRKRCQLCMAPAVKGQVFKMKTCMDCWDDIGMPAHELYFLRSIDITGIPYEYVTRDYIDSSLRFNARWDWDLLFFFKPGNLRRQFEEAMNAPSAADGPSTTLLKFTRTVFQEMHKWIVQIKRSKGWRYTAHYHPYRHTEPEKWYTPNVEDLVPPHEVIQRFLDFALASVLGDAWRTRSNYQLLPSPEELYGPNSEFRAQFPKTKCELQVDEAYLAEFGEDPDNFHECDIECQRKERAKLFRKLWWPGTEDRLLRMLIGETSVTLTAAEADKMVDMLPRFNWRTSAMEIIDGMLAGCKWIVPGVNGDYLAEKPDPTAPDTVHFFRPNQGGLFGSVGRV